MKKRKRYISINESFSCENCGRSVPPHGGGSCRNHCPYCLWSKHVDENLPGDRASSCLGLMKPVGIVIKSGKTSVLHRCVECGLEKLNKTAEDDAQEIIITLSAVCGLEDSKKQ